MEMKIFFISSIRHCGLGQKSFVREHKEAKTKTCMRAVTKAGLMGGAEQVLVTQAENHC